MDSEDIAGASNPSSNDTMDPKMKKPKTKEETEKKADTYCSPLPFQLQTRLSSSSNDGSSTASAPPSDFSAARM
jgi:hypothetical protein